LRLSGPDKMPSFSTLLAAASAVTGALAIPGLFDHDLNLFHKINSTAAAEAGRLSSRDTLVSPGTGTHNGFFYSFWTDGKGSVQYDNLAAGGYSTRWSNVNNFVAGKGWNPGGEKTVYATSGGFCYPFGINLRPETSALPSDSFSPIPGRFGPLSQRD
jgi:glycosyl hydrolase family 11